MGGRCSNCLALILTGKIIMDYELPEELRMMKDTLRRFVDREIIPIERDAYVLSLIHI